MATVPAHGVPNVLLTLLYKGTPMHSTTLRRAPAPRPLGFQASRLPGFQPAGLQPQVPGLQLPATNSATGTRTRVARVRAEYPNQLDYSGDGALAVSSKTTSKEEKGPCKEDKDPWSLLG